MAKQQPKPKPKKSNTLMSKYTGKKTVTITRKSSTGLEDRNGKYVRPTKGSGTVYKDAGRSRLKPKTSAQKMQENAARAAYIRMRDKRLKLGETQAQAVAGASRYVRENFNLGGTRRGNPKYKFKGPRDYGDDRTTTMTGRRVIIRKKK